MPQLDITTYHTQIVWLIIIFTIYYYIFNTKLLPNIAYILKMRRLFNQKLAHSLRLHHREISRSSSSPFISRQLSSFKSFFESFKIINSSSISIYVDSSPLLTHHLYYRSLSLLSSF